MTVHLTPVSLRRHGGLFFNLLYSRLILEVSPMERIAMAYRTKQETIELAEELGIDLTGLTWPQMQKVVSDALKQQNNPAPKVNVNKHNDDKMRPYRGKTVLIAPEMPPDAKRYIHYDEELGDDLDVEEVSMLGFEGGKIDWRGTNDMVTGTFRVKGKTGRKVHATSALPRQNAQITLRPGIDYFPVVKFQGKRGYIFKHPKLYSFRNMLEELEMYDEYRNTLQRNGVLFYLTGLLCIDIGVAHNIMRDIEKKFKREDIMKWRY